MRAERRGKGCRVRSSLPFLSAHLSTLSPMAHPSARTVIPTMVASASGSELSPSRQQVKAYAFASLSALCLVSFSSFL